MEIDNKIERLRNIIIEKVRNSKDDIVFLDLDKDMLEIIIFRDCNGNNIVSNYGKKHFGKEFSLPYDVLKKIDFKNVSFDDFNLQRDKNIYNLNNVFINPQTIYRKDLSNCNFSGVTFTGPFDKCFIEGSNFSHSACASIDIRKLKTKVISSMNEVIVDLRRCNFKDVTFENIIESFSLKITSDLLKNEDNKVYPYLEGASFEGCNKVTIDLDKLKESNNKKIITDCNLCDTLIKGTFDDLLLRGVKFKGACSFNDKDGISVNPNKVFEEDGVVDFRYTNFSSVTFKDIFKKLYKLERVVFKDSKNGFICLEQIKDKKYTDTIDFSDMKVYFNKMDKSETYDNDEISYNKDLENLVDGAIKVYKI